MAHVLILLGKDNGDAQESQWATDAMVAALKQAIAASPVQMKTVQVCLSDSTVQTPAEDTILCPLTLDVPTTVALPLYQTCRQVDQLRGWVEQRFRLTVGEGHLWLPIVLTAKGPLYGEVIGASTSQVLSSSGPEAAAQFGEAAPYRHPVHLPDRLRQPLYRLGGQLLRSLAATPSVYLLQFGFDQGEIRFDRLFPFPSLPAIASIGVQTPDLFTCYWRCLTNQPLLDLTIPGTVPYWTLTQDGIA